MQPDREDAERDDAAVEVAAHLSLRAFRERCLLSPLCSRLGVRAACSSASAAAAVVKSRLGVQWHLTPKAHRAAIKRPREVCRAAPLRATLLVAALRRQKPRLPLALVSYRPLAAPQLTSLVWTRGPCATRSRRDERRPFKIVRRRAIGSPSARAPGGGRASGPNSQGCQGRRQRNAQRGRRTGDRTYTTRQRRPRRR